MARNIQLLHKIQNYEYFIYILCSILLNLFIHLLVSLIYYNPVDFVLQLEAAKEIAQGRMLYRDIGEIIINNSELPRPQYPPLYLYSLATFIAIIGVDNFSWQMAKLFLIFFNLISGLLVYFIVFNYLQQLIPHSRNHIIALIACNWFLLNPSTLGVVYGGYHENFMVFFCLLAFILFIRKHYLLSGICFGLAMLVKPTAGICMLPLVVWMIQQKDWKSISIWLTAGGTFLLVSLPFLLITPDAYLTDVFFIHTSRPDPSMSFYTYFFTDFSTSLFPFFIQALVILTILILLSTKLDNFNYSETLELALPFTTIFLALNRILYPHYIAFIFPFFTFHLFFRISRRINNESSLKKDFNGLILLAGLLIVFIGGFWWSLLWLEEKYYTYATNPFFAFSSLVCIFGFLLISITSIYSLYNSKRAKFNNEMNNST